MNVIAFPHSPARTAELRDSQLDELAQRAYGFGFPLVLMDAARETMQAPNDAKAWRPVVLHTSATSLEIPCGIVDVQPFMLFSCAWLDLCRSPVILSTPDMAGRYYTASALDAWSDVFASLGTRTNGGRARNYAFIGPSWRGRLPDGVVKVQTSTPMIWLQMRVRANESDARALQERLRLSLLSEWGGSAEPRSAELETILANASSPVDRVLAMPASEFYGRFCALMVDNPPHPEDGRFAAELRLLGLERTRSFDFGGLSRDAKRALSDSVERARARITESKGRLAPMRLVNGWRIPRNTCRFGGDSDRRAYLALLGLRARDMADCIVATAQIDDQGEALRGDRAYDVAFDSKNIPPVKAFWSLSVRAIDPRIAAPVKAAINGASELKSGKDGRIILRIQRSHPKEDANWLPIEVDEFALALELHWPADSALEGRWRPPPVRRLD